MPVLLAGREPDHITGPDLLDRSAFALNPAAAGRDDESLTEWMRVPCSPRARLEGYAGALNTCRIGCLKKRVDSYRATEPIRRPLGGRLRANSFDLHAEFLYVMQCVWSSYFSNRSKRYASSGPPSPSYASWATSSANGSVYRAIRRGPASTASKPTSPISWAAASLARSSSPQYTRLGRSFLRLASNTANSTSLGTVLKAETTLAFGTFFASSSAPDEVLAMMSFVLPASIGSEQVTTTLPAKSPACFSTSSIRDQCTARRSASASFAASPGVPARAWPWAWRASLLSLSLLRA